MTQFERKRQMVSLPGSSVPIRDLVAAEGRLMAPGAKTETILPSQRRQVFDLKDVVMPRGQIQIQTTSE